LNSAIVPSEVRQVTKVATPDLVEHHRRPRERHGQQRRRGRSDTDEQPQPPVHESPVPLEADRPVQVDLRAIDRRV
jgi:hypothetical protein